MTYRRYFILCGLVTFCLAAPRVVLQAQQQGSSGSSDQQTSDKDKPQDDSVAKPPQSTGNKKQDLENRKKRDKELYKELDSPYKKWLNEDVVYIITPEERSSFIHLSTNEEREEFIEQFWQRRNPDPDSTENSFKEEHYRRIAYTNEHFASGIPGWKTDRGRIYIMWGPADEVDSHPSGGSYERPANEGGGETSTYPFEDWRYRYLEGIGENVEIEFVDPTMTGEFHLTMDPSEKDALLYVPGAGLTQMESMGMSSKTARFNNTDGTHLAAPLGGEPENQNEFTRLELYANIQKAPPVKFKDLESVVSQRMIRDQMKFDYRFDFLRITGDTVLVPITLQVPNKQMFFTGKDGVQSASVNIFGRITTLSGRVVNTFEDTIRKDTTDAQLPQMTKGASIYGKAVPLSPGLYRLDVVMKDVNSGNVGAVNTRLAVPRYDEDKLASSSLIIADQITPVSSKNIGLGQFVLGDMKVRPKLDGSFYSRESLGVYLQVYNLKVDDKTHKSDATVVYVVTQGKDPNPVLTFDETSDKLNEHGEEMTLERPVALSSLAPGKYKLEVRVTDNLGKQTITPTAEFTVKEAAK
jgi:GWxTD domain-containing protein